MMRIILFLLTNLAVMLLFSIILSFTSISNSSITSLVIISGLLGFSGSIISLLMSKYIALHSVNGKIIKKPCNKDEQWLLTTVKKQALQANITVPQIAIYHALDINAFATGARKNSSLIAISTGLLEKMNNDEAEAVIAHEISHIVNGDMVTMTLLQGIMNTFVIFISRIIAQLITSLLSSSDRKDNENIINNHHLLYSCIALILELVFGILANIITLWFSRYREFHADAGSASLVGREKMISALQRLKESYAPQEDNNIILFCINGRDSKFSNLFMSHPSLDKRIAALRLGMYTR